MVYYVVYRASKEFKDRGKIPKRLRALNCTQIRRSFWKVNEEDINMVLKVLHKNQPVLLKRVRELQKPQPKTGKVIPNFGSLIIIAYKAPKEVKQEKIRNFLRKAPCIRLCSSVYAFCQEHKRFDKKGELVQAKSFWKFIREIDEDVKVIPRVVVANSDSVERLLKETKKRVEKEIDNIVRGYESLYHKASHEEIDEQLLHSTHLKLKSRFTKVRQIAPFYEKWLKTDLSKNLLKPYPAIKRLRSVISEEYGLV